MFIPHARESLILHSPIKPNELGPSSGHSKTLRTPSSLQMSKTLNYRFEFD